MLKLCDIGYDDLLQCYIYHLNIFHLLKIVKLMSSLLSTR